MRTSAAVMLGAIALVSLSAIGCSSSGTTGTGTPAPSGTQNPGLMAPGQTPTGHDTNPYGVAYPNANLGTSQRRGAIPGNQIRNYKFLGYPKGDMTQPLQTVALADFYDPQGKLGFKLIHLGVAAVWCTPCNEETNATVPLIAGLLKQGVVFAQALDDGPTMGTGATLSDLKGWIDNHHSDFTEMLDPNNNNLGVFFDAAAIPWNAIIDARSMEILTDGTGYSGDVSADLAPWIAWVNDPANPPSYKPQ